MNNRTDIVTVVGARPQFIKAAPVSNALHDAGLVESIIHTGQHFDQNMSDVFFDEMGIPKPNYFLGIAGLSHGAMTGEMLRQIEEVLQIEQPKALLVYGDTNSTLAGALAASKLKIPIAHIEAGLRSHNMDMPEEINRIVTDRISKWLFCPTPNAKAHLVSEGYPLSNYSKIFEVGDVMLDATLKFKPLARWPSTVPLDFREHPFVLCTLHRQESTDDIDVFKSLIGALREISTFKPVIWPVHPRSRKKIDSEKIDTTGLILIEPVGYLEMLALISASSIVATDSGGLQKEAYFFNKPCLTLRNETEWEELVAIGANIVCGFNKEQILREFHSHVGLRPHRESPYGDGTAAKKIAKALVAELRQL